MKFKTIRKDGLQKWLSETGRTFKTTDNISGSFECKWQDPAIGNGYNHISIFCSIGEFASHITDILRDYRFDKYEFNQSDEVDEVLFRYYSRLLLIVSEVITDLQDLWILANYNLSTKEYNGLDITTKREYQDNARNDLSINADDLNNLFDFINRICKHKTQNFHLCNNHIKYHFEDFKNTNGLRKTIKIGNIKQYISYNKDTFKKHMKPNVLIIPKLNFILDSVLNSYVKVNNLFATDFDKFNHVCNHFDDK